MSDKMLFASKREGELLRALKWALTGTELFIISVDGRNTRLTQILECFNPIFFTKDTIEAGYFTAKIFPDVEVLIDEEPFLQEEDSENSLLAASSNLANLVVKMKGDNIAVDTDDQVKESKSDENGLETGDSGKQFEEIVCPNG